jgi:type IV pilus assembly protein PilQ
LPETSLSSEPDDPAYELAKECIVTNVFYDTDVREILTAMAAQCYVNVIADETVSGILTVEIEDLPLEEAMRRVLSPFGLTYKWMGGYYLVGSARPDNPSYPLLAITELYRPRHIKAADVPKLMSKYYEPFLLVNSETNTVSLSGAPEIIEAMKEDLAQIDLPPRQVMIEALVTEATSDVNRALGVSWTYQGTRTDSDKSFRVDAYPQTGPTADSTIGGFVQRIGIQSGDWLTDYRVRLSAFEETGEARIRANPRIATLEGSQARIFVGREEYFTIVTGSVAYAYAQLEVIKTGISLTITPYVSDNGEIRLEVEPWVSDVIGSGSTGLPVTSMRSVTTKVRVREGETVVIGGLTVQYRQEVQRRIPLLGSIPILGYLFRHTETSVTENEITVLITPRIWIPEPATEG